MRFIYNLFYISFKINLPFLLLNKNNFAWYYIQKEEFLFIFWKK